MNRLLFTLATVAALWTAACGSGGGAVNPPPPVGKFSNASLNGQYAFVTNGEVFTGGLSPTPLARVGSFTADGKGGITGGVEDVNLAGVVNPSAAITGGNYTVNADGRGFMTLQLGQASIDFGITLTSTNDGLMIDETSNSNQSSTGQSSTGSGNFVKQEAGPFAISDLDHPYVFDFSGLDGTNAPESFIGEFTSNNGVISTGFFDDNVNGNFSSGAFIGTIAQDPLNLSAFSSFGRGVALIAGQNFVFYIVDSTRVRFLSTNLGMLSGDAIAQSSNIPTNVTSLNSGFAFIVAGSSGSGGLIRVGRFTANGTTMSNVLVDTNNAGAFTLTNSGINGVITLDSAGTGRGTVTFKDPNLAIPFRFVFYLSSATQGVIQETSQTNQGAGIAVADGSILAQTGSPFTSSNISGTYALNWSGLSVQQGGTFAILDEEDLVGQATVSNLNLTGAADIFQFTGGVPQFDNIVGGTITINGDGTGGTGTRNSMSVKLTKGSSATVNFVVYFVNPQLAFIANNTNTGTQRIVAGILKAQQ